MTPMNAWEDQLIAQLPRPEDADDAEYEAVWDVVADAIHTANIGDDDPERFVSEVLDRVEQHINTVRAAIAELHDSRTAS